MESLPLGVNAHLEFVQIHAEQAQEAERHARLQLERATKLREFWEDLLEHVKRSNHASALLVLRQAEQNNLLLDELDEAANQKLRELRDDCEKKARDAAARFDRFFPEAVRSTGLEMDATSRHPRYTFEQRFIQVDVNEQELTATFTTRDGNTVVLGLDVSPLVERIKKERTRLFDREFQPEAFLKRIYKAYQYVIRTEKRSDGDEIPLRRLTSHLSKNLHRFAADEFNVDLSRLIKSNNLVIDGHRLHVNHTRNTRLGMLLHGLEQGGYVGFISFKKEDGA